MRIFFSCRPAAGHVHPLIPLALAARNAGHEVVFGTGTDFLPPLRALGFAAHKVGIAIPDAEAEARRLHGDHDVLELMLTMFGDLLPRHTIGDLTPLIGTMRPDLIVYEQSDVGAAAVGSRAGVPIISHVIGRSMPASARQHSATRLGWLWGDHTPADPMLGDACLDIWPTGLPDPATADVPTRIPVRPVPWNEPGELPATATATRSRPLVYLTLGTVAFGAVKVMRAAIDGLAALPVDVIVAVGPGDPTLLGPLPPGVHVERFVPQAELLAHVDLVVHHGGTGTMLGALASALPQLILPQGADQFVNAESLTGQGTGRHLLPPDVTAAAITEHVSHLLSDTTHRDAARALAADIAAMPSPHDVIPALVDFATAHVG
ncbi:glycosyltransferase [Kibdelosporangium phytohabitans]|uniref:Glycosyl transferase n=1 Tax=Kibdelosporangium phytohabitans TaxID=860235 RepID=A0A0N7F4R8_9PSEU|nr:glycosyltransferase [Kibdelosporangium phytohabitans]ALG12191.1 glycosyl transferase [Kibdelosporangium phytohabitans]MBE1463721.1 UDP:flavonoid glycosyltransferase YjiC (YdhE family) [Kibdelosporangium phytohabitans]